MSTELPDILTAHRFEIARSIARAADEAERLARTIRDLANDTATGKQDPDYAANAAVREILNGATQTNAYILAIMRETVALAESKHRPA